MRTQQFKSECVVDDKLVTLTIDVTEREDENFTLSVAGLEHPIETIGAWATPEEANEYVPVLLGDLRRNVRCIRHATFTFDTPPTEAEITKAEVSPVVVEMFARVKAAEPVVEPLPIVEPIRRG